MKKLLVVASFFLLLSYSLLAQNKTAIDPTTVTFPLKDATTLATNEATIQELSKNVAAYLQQLQDSSWLLQGASREIQQHLLISCLFAAGEYNNLPAIIQQYRKESTTPYTQRLGKAFIESYIKALPFKNDSSLFKNKYETFFDAIFQNAILEDLPRLENNKTDAATGSAAKNMEDFKNALPAASEKSIDFGKAIALIFAYTNTKFSTLQDAELAVYKRSITRLENSKGNPIAAKFKLPTSPIAITHVTVVNVISGKPDADQTILIDKNKITAVGGFKKIKIPAGTTIIDGKGKYAMPGLTDAHIHFFQSGGLYTRPDGLSIPSVYPYEKDQQWLKENMYDLMARYLACGITNVIDVGGPMSNFTMREKVNQEISSPNALVTGPLISTLQPTAFSKDDPPIIKANTPQEARELVKKQLPFKPDFIKIWFLVTTPGEAANNLAIVKATIEESHANGLKVCVHATEYETARLAIEAGADILVHSVDDKVFDEYMLNLLKTKKIVYIPTLQVGENYSRVFSQRFAFSPHDLKYANPFMLGSTMDLQHIPNAVSGIDYKAIQDASSLVTPADSIMAKNLFLVWKAGINIVAGTDAGNVGTHHGSSFLKELELMKAAGLPAIEIIRSATINAAKGFGKESEWGSIEKNKIADILLLDSNPLENLQALDNIPTVMHRGVVMETSQLLNITPETLIQQQLNAYNARDIEAFLATYSDSTALYSFPNQLLSKGKAAMRTDYTELFKAAPGLHCEVAKRIVLGNTVIDYEKVSGLGNEKAEAIAIYEIEHGKIVRVYFKN